MKIAPLFHAACAALLVLAALKTPAAAAERTWVSIGGADSNLCTRVSPCLTFQGAHDKTDPGGEINCLEEGSISSFRYNGATLTKSITIDCAGTSAQSQGFVIFGAGIVVVIRNLTINGFGLNGDGIVFLEGAALFVEHCAIANLNMGVAGQGVGIQFAPKDGVAGNLYVTDSIIRNAGLASSGGGIIIQPALSASARVMIERTRVENNTYGIFANGTGSFGVIAVQVKDSVVANNRFNGISAFTAAGRSITSITVDRSSSVLNGQAGILSQSSNAFVFLGSSTVMGNGTGLSAVDGGSIFSYQNNQLTGNVSDGAPTGVLTVR